MKMISINGGSRPLDSAGFSLIELIVYMIVVGILMFVVMMSFTGVVQRSAQETSVAETGIETVVGLDLLRSDLEHAGFGLPWRYQNTINFAEPSAALPPHGFAVGNYDPTGDMTDAPSGEPKALISQDSMPDTVNASDYLIIRGTNLTLGTTTQRWGYIGRSAPPASNIVIQSMGVDPFVATDRVIVIRPVVSPGIFRELVMNGGNYFEQAQAASLGNYAPAPTPNDPDGIKLIIYGLNNDAGISRPFNRVDYFINNANIAAHCAQGTGTLTKAQLNQANNLYTYMPIVDCVADFQVLYFIDTNDDGGWDTRVNANGLNGFSAQDIRNRVKLVRYYVLTHEGGFDQAYTYPNNTILVGDIDAATGNTLNAADGVANNAGNIFNFTAAPPPIVNWANYRWKVESGSVALNNLQ